jgi:hypothetical protein
MEKLKKEKERYTQKQNRLNKYVILTGAQKRYIYSNIEIQGIKREQEGSMNSELPTD